MRLRSELCACRAVHRPEYQHRFLQRGNNRRALQTTTDSAATTITITGTNNGFGLAATQSGTTPTPLTVTNSGSVVIDSAAASSASRPVLQLTGNGGLINYSGSGGIADTTFTSSSPALTINNISNGGGDINVNTGTASISGVSAINLTTSGNGTISLTTADAITSTPLGGGISTTTVSVSQRHQRILTAGSIQATSFGISAISTGNGALTVNMTGGQITSGLTGDFPSVPPRLGKCACCRQH